MSQAKVDKRKYEKVHRKEIERKRKIATAVKCVVAALIIGAIIGIPTGIRIYREMPKFVGDATLASFIGNYIDENYASDIEVLNSSEDTADTTESTDPVDAVSDAIEKATGETPQQVTDIDSDTSDGSEDTQTTEAE